MAAIKSVVKPNPSALPRSGAAGMVEVRVDGPHVLGDGPPIAAERPDFVADDAAPAELWEQMRLQATQLSRHLVERQRDLDRRESRLNNDLAQLDQEARKARLWFDERRQEQDELSAALERQRQEAEEHRSRLVSAEQYHDQACRESEARQVARAAELDRREEQLAAVAARLAQREAEATARLAQREADDDARLAQRETACATMTAEVRAEQERATEALRGERQAIDAQRSAALELARNLLAAIERRRAAVEAHAAQIDERLRQQSEAAFVRERQLAAELDARRDSLADELDAQRATLAAEYGQREQALHDREANLLAEKDRVSQLEAELLTEQAELAEQRQDLVRWRQRAQRQIETDREEIDRRERMAAARFAGEQQVLERRGEQLDLREVAIARRLEEMRAAQRETLEARLATEELWAQVTGTASAPALTQALARLRGNLADQYRLANAELGERRSGLEALSQRLAEHHERLAADKRDLQDWFSRRQEEVERQAAMLVAREQELDRQQGEFERLQQLWQDERLEYQRQVRELRAATRELEASLA